MGKWKCSKCSGDMKINGFILECVDCGYSIMKASYGNEDNDEYDYKPYKDDTPEGCAACGGPYPSCKTSCTLFD